MESAAALYLSGTKQKSGLAVVQPEGTGLSVSYFSFSALLAVALLVLGCFSNYTFYIRLRDPWTTTETDFDRQVCCWKDPCRPSSSSPGSDTKHFWWRQRMKTLWRKVVNWKQQLVVQVEDMDRWTAKGLEKSLHWWLEKQIMWGFHEHTWNVLGGWEVSYGRLI